MDARRTTVYNLPPELAQHPQYEVLRELGSGGMGIVYLAKNKLMDRLEVLKVVNKALLDHPGSVERFLREIRSAAKLNHPNVVAAYSALQIGELLVFAMEYVEGDDLAALVKSQGPLPVSVACFYVQQAALGLQHAFEKEMVHRDVKPQNLMRACAEGKHSVKVVDFGLAKATREKTDNTELTVEGQMLGTAGYIAPEQALDATKADIRADLYSLGCTLYYLLSGRPPFSGSSAQAVLLAHQTQQAPSLNLVRTEVPEELAAVVRKMMAKTPAQRYQTPLDVVQALRPFVEQPASPKSPPDASAWTEAVVHPEQCMTAAPACEKSLPPSPATEAALRSGGIASAQKRKGWAPGANTKAPIGGGIVAAVLLLTLLGMWASGVFQGKTKDAAIVPDNVPAGASPAGHPAIKPDFVEEFDQTKVLTDTANDNEGFRDGAYYRETHWPGNGHWGRSFHTYKDGILEVRARVAKGFFGGWIVNLENSEHKHGIRILVSGDGQLWVLPSLFDRKPEAGPKEVHLKHPAIKPGGEWNTLRLVIDGQKLGVYMNGERLGDTITTSFTIAPGVMCLGNSDDRRNARVEFDRYVLWPTTDIEQLPAEANGSN